MYRYTKENEKKVKIEVLTEIIKYLFIKGKKKRYEIIGNCKPYFRSLINDIGLYDEEKHHAWISRSWAPIAFKNVFPKEKISPYYNPYYAVVYFNLLWVQNIPKDLVNMIIEYVDFDLLLVNKEVVYCDYCDQLVNHKHFYTKTHLKKCEKIVELPKYLKNKTYTRINWKKWYRPSLQHTFYMLK